MLAAAAAVCVAVFAVYHQRYKELTEPETVEFSLAASAYTAQVQADFFEDTLIPCELDGIYYSISPDASEFYTLTSSGFERINENCGRVKISVKRAYETLEAAVDYIEKDGRIFGAGVFLSDSDEAPAYPYALFRLCGTKENCLLLLSFDYSELYKSNRTYSEIYSYSFESGKAVPLIDENNRLVNVNGAPRDDWSMITDTAVANSAADYFFSSRNYSYDDGSCDIFRLSGKTLPDKAAQDALGLWISNKNSALRYFKKSDDGFVLKQIKDKKESGQLSFKGDFYKDYIVSGNVIFDKENCEFTDLETLRSVKLEGFNATGAADFAINGDMSRCVIIFPEREQENSVTVQKVAFCSLDTGAVAVFEEPLIYNSAVDFVFVSPDTVMHSRLSDEATGRYSTCVYKF